MKKISCLQALFALVFLLASPVQTTLFAQAIAYYSGNVKNTDNQPIENVSVIAPGADTVTTNNSGDFLLEFTSLQINSFTPISFMHNEYLTLDINVYIVEGDSITNQEIVLSPDTSQPIAYYSGIVTDPGSQPIENVTVNAQGADPVLTGSQGEFLLEFTEVRGPNFTNVISFQHPQYIYHEEVINISPGDSIINQVIVLTPSQNHTVTGNVKYQDNQPVQFGEVAFLNANATTTMLTTMTDEQGNYSIQLQSGFYYVRSKASYSQGNAWAYRYLYWDNAASLMDADLLHVTSNVSDINFTHKLLQLGTISGNVVDAVTNLPLSGAGISLSSVPLTDSSLIVTGPDGNYTADVFEGEYIVSAYSQDYQVQFYDHVTSYFDATPVSVASGSLNVTDIDFSLSPEGDGTNSISGYVFDSNTGLPLADVYVYVVSLSTGEIVNSSAVQNKGFKSEDGKLLKTDNNGAYTIGKIKDGNVVILFYREDYNSAYYNSFNWEDAVVFRLIGNSNFTDVNANLMKSGEFGGEITGSVFTTGSATTMLSSSLITAYNSSGEVVAATVSAFDGKYLLPSLQNGMYTVKASRVGYATTQYSQPVSIDLVHSPVINGIDIQVNSSPASVYDNGRPAYELYQNYPNPFNPVTSIKYKTKEKGFVSLKVYDLLGREVAYLVNEVREPGSYSVFFNAEGLPSGVYIYSLRVNDLVQNKKMTLIK